MRVLGLFIVGIVSILPLSAFAASAHSMLMVSATAVANCSVEIDDYDFNHHKQFKELKRERVHTKCAGGEMVYQISYDRDDEEYDKHFEKHSEYSDDGVRWLTAEF